MSWNPEADLSYTEKQAVLREYFDAFRPAVVIETGLYNGNGSSYQFHGEAEIAVFDISEEQCRIALQRGATYAIGGDTRDSFAQFLALVTRPALFWLDSHAVVDVEEENDSPLMEELDAIQAWPHARESVVLIDDMRMMGLPGWPTVEHVRAKVAGWWTRSEEADIMRLTPR